MEACQPPATIGRSGFAARTARATATPWVIMGPVTMLMPRQVAPLQAATTSATGSSDTAESTMWTWYPLSTRGAARWMRARGGAASSEK